MSVWPLLFAALALVGCARGAETEVKNASDGKVAKAEPKWECRDERQTGSLISTKVCRRMDAAERDSVEAQEEMLVVMRRSAQRMPRGTD